MSINYRRCRLCGFIIGRCIIAKGNYEIVIVDNLLIAALQTFQNTQLSFIKCDANNYNDIVRYFWLFILIMYFTMQP